MLPPSMGAILLEPAFSQHQQPSAAKSDVDLQIGSMLRKLEIMLGVDEPSVTEATRMLGAACDLLPIASDTGQQLIAQFPQHLQARANEQHDGGSPIKSVYYETFAELALQCAHDQQESRKPDSDIGVAAEKEHGPPSIAPDQPAIAKLPDPPPVHQSIQEHRNSDNHIGVAAAMQPGPPSIALTPPLPAKSSPDHPRSDDPLTLSSAVQRALLKRGDTMLRQGNVIAARMLFSRAVDAGLSIAALKLADTYDPEFINDHNLIGIKGDPLQAEAWYRRAAALGEKDAERRLKLLEGREKTLAIQ